MNKIILILSIYYYFILVNEISAKPVLDLEPSFDYGLTDIQLPYDSSYDKIRSLSASSWNPIWSALFWTDWSDWTKCGTGCIPQTESILSSDQNYKNRTRVCKQRSINSYLRWSKSSVIGINPIKDLTPCTENNKVALEFEPCPTLVKCNQTDNQTTINYELNITTTKVTNTDCSTADCGSTTLAVTDQTIIKKMRKENASSTKNWTNIHQCSPIIPTIDELPNNYPWESMLQTTRKSIGHRCEPGYQLQVPECSGNDCKSTEINSKIRKIHCWIDEGCTSIKNSIQPPSSCIFQAVSNVPDVYIKWRRTPYGSKPDHFEIQITDLDNTTNLKDDQLQTHYVPLKEEDVWGEIYELVLKSLKINNSYQIRIASSDDRDSTFFSKACEGIITTGIADGAWSSWSEWSKCNSSCASKMGNRYRYRSCDSPSPEAGGQYCPGADRMTVLCFGTDINC